MRRDQIHDSLGLQQVDAASQEGAPCEFSWIRQTGTVFEDGCQQTLGADTAAMDMEFDQILARIARWAPEGQQQGFIQIPAGIMYVAIDHLPGWSLGGEGTLTTKNPVGNPKGISPGYPDDGNARGTRCRGQGCYCVFWRIHPSMLIHIAEKRKTTYLARFGDTRGCDISYVKGVSNPDDSSNMLSKVADNYDQVLVTAKAGDVVFFNGHVLHRSKQNWSTDRFRRAFVSHYCNARSFTQWGADMVGDNANRFQPSAIHPWPPQDPVTHMTNGSHILARGDTHLPFARPRFGTPCAATDPADVRAARYSEAAQRIAVNGAGLLGCAIADPTLPDDDDTPPDASSNAGHY